MKIKGLTALIVDDEISQRNILKEFLGSMGAITIQASNGIEALQVLQENGQIELLITDLQMPHLDGLELSKKALELREDLSIILVTAHGTIESAIQATKLGVSDYVQKPIEFEELELRMTRVLQFKALNRKKDVLEKENQRLKKNRNLVVQSNVMKKLFNDIEKILTSDTTVLLNGETGVGKEVVANYIHNNSSRSSGPFMAINCSAIPENLLESQFFGHEKGAFTGADRRMIGSFELANGGTLFLDEIGEMDLKLQAKILRALEERKINRTGNPHPIEIDVRIVAATNRDLTEMVQAKLFREDLYYRLKVVHFLIPPLRERIEDLPFLIQSFVEREIGTKKKDTITILPEFYQCLSRYQFPGNVRELRNLVERAVLFSSQGVLTKDSLPPELNQISPQSNKSSLANSQMNLSLSGKALAEIMADFEREILNRSLDANSGDLEKVGKALKVSRSALYAKLAKYGLK